MTIEFQAWPKIPRLKKGVIITEKIDGTNAAVGVTADGRVYAQSRTRIITPEADNFGFANWVQQNEDVLRTGLGEGLHFGEWWGQGVQRTYGLDYKRFSLFNTKRWQMLSHRDDQGCSEGFEGLHDIGVRVVPVIGSGPFDSATIEWACDTLRTNGSFAAPGFAKPEGVVVFHTQSQQMYKVLLENDDIPKSLVEAA